MPDGTLKPGIFGFRTIGDCQRIAAYVAGKKRVAVIGGGLLGMECARALTKFDVEVHIINDAMHLMNQQIDPQAARFSNRRSKKWASGFILGSGFAA